MLERLRLRERECGRCPSLNAGSLKFALAENTIAKTLTRWRRQLDKHSVS